ncbi:hypothetical protein ACS5UN_000420 [Escherichia coli]
MERASKMPSYYLYDQ